MSSKNSNSNGIGVVGALGVAFVVLRLTDVIDWPWWLVTLPFWAGIVVLLVVLIIWLFSQLLKPKIPTVERGINIKNKSKFAQRLEEAKQKQKQK